MAEKEFLLGVKTRELLKYTKQATKVVSDDISPQDVRTILHRIAALEDIRDAREVCSQAINAIDRKQKDGFTKTTFRFYGQDMRDIAKQILAIKERFGVRYYGRQMDDFFIIEESKERLQGLLRDIRTIVGGLGLELNNKTAIFPLRNGIDFLGFHAYLTDTGAVVQKLRRDSINRMKGRIKYWRTAYPAGEVTKDEIKDSWTAWDAHAAHGDTHALRSKIAEQVGAIIGETLQPRRKITASPFVRQLRRLKQQRRSQPNPPPEALAPAPRPDWILPWE